MPPFNPDVKGFDAEPNYLRYSKGLGSNNATGDLIKNSGKLFEQGVDVYNEAEGRRATAAIKQDIGGLFDGAAPTDEASTQRTAPEGGTGNSWTPTLVSNPQEEKPLPDTAKGGVKDIESLQQGYQSGRLSESYYWGALAAKVSQIKARYPGHDEEIDKAVQKSTGHNPANMFIQTQFRMQQEEYKAQVTNDKAVEAYIRQHPDDAPPDYYERKLSGNPYPLAVAEAYTAKNVATKQKLDYDKKQLQETRLERQDVNERGSRILNSELNLMTDRFLTDGTDLIGKKFSDAFKVAQEKGKDASPQELQAVESALQAVEIQWDSKFNKVLSAPWAGDTTKSYYTELDPKSIEAVKKQAKERLQTYAEMLRNKDYGILNVHAQNAKRIHDADVQSMLEKNDAARLYYAAKTIGVTDAINARLQSPDAKFKTDYASVANYTNLFKATTDAKSPSLTETFDKISKDQSAEDKKGVAKKTLVTGSDYKAMINQYTGLIKDPSLSKEGFDNLFNHMFDERNKNFLSLFRPNDQVKVYQTMLTPEITDKVKERAKADPSVWEKYKAFALSGFQSTMGSSLNDVSNWASKDIQWDVHYDPKSNQFSSTPSKFQQRSGYGDAVDKNHVDSTITSLNRQLKVLEPILGHDKTPVADQIATVLRARGIQIDPADSENKPGTFWQKVAAAIGPALVAGATTDENSKGNTSSARAAWNNPGRDPELNPVKPEGSYSGGISLDEDKLAAGKQHKPLMSLIKQAESGDDYESIWGGKGLAGMHEHSVDDVLKFQEMRAKTGVKSTAVGGYQFLRSTLEGLKKDLGLKGDEAFTPELQDRLAMALLHRRGLGDFESGKIDSKEFAGRLAKEFAGLPESSGFSHYHGDGLNKSSVNYKDLLKAIEAIKKSHEGPGA